jgi:hypothetical protein
MGIPIDDEPLEPTDDAPVTPLPTELDDDLGADVSPADAADQRREVSPGWRIGRRSSDLEAPEADVLDQAISPPLDDEPDV